MLVSRRITNGGQTKSDLEEALTFGNHQGAEQSPKVLTELVEKDVTHGYGLVLPSEN